MIITIFIFLFTHIIVSAELEIIRGTESDLQKFRFHLTKDVHPIRENARGNKPNEIVSSYPFKYSDVAARSKRDTRKNSIDSENTSKRFFEEIPKRHYFSQSDNGHPSKVNSLLRQDYRKNQSGNERKSIHFNALSKIKKRLPSSFGVLDKSERGFKPNALVNRKSMNEKYLLEHPIRRNIFQRAANSHQRHVFHSNPHAKYKVGMVRRYNDWNRNMKRAELPHHTSKAHIPAPFHISREKKAASDHFDGGHSYFHLNWITLFFILIPLVSFAAILLTVVHHFWTRRSSKKQYGRLSSNTSISTSESTVASVSVDDDSSSFKDTASNKHQDSLYLPGTSQHQKPVKQHPQNKSPNCNVMLSQSELDTSGTTTSSDSSISSSQRLSRPNQNKYLQTRSVDARRPAKNSMDANDPRPNQKQFLSIHNAEVRRSEPAKVGRGYVATAIPPEATKRASSVHPVIPSLQSKLDKPMYSTGYSIKDTGNRSMNESLATFKSHHVTVERYPAQRYNYTLRENSVGNKGKLRS